MRTIIAGNWKMHKDRGEALALIDALVAGLKDVPEGPEVVVAPPFTFLAEAVQHAKGSPIRVAAQNCHQAEQGAFTGEVSAGMLKSIGVTHCIVGHSERRQYSGETDAAVGEKIVALLAHGITPIFCCGEKKEERESGHHFDVVTEQMKGALGRLENDRLKRVVIAYEPVWAIGTGRTASPEQAQAVHAVLRAQLAAATPRAGDMKLLYGGSVKPDNAAILFSQADIDGGLIGGAALKAADFVAVARAAS